MTYYRLCNENNTTGEPGWLNKLGSWKYLATHTSLSPIRRGFALVFVNYKNGCIRLAAASDKVYQLLAHGRWFSPCTPASSTTKTGRHDRAEILLKVALSTKKSINQSINQSSCHRKDKIKRDNRSCFYKSEKMKIIRYWNFLIFCPLQ